MALDPRARQIKCELCGAEFACSRSAGCWCTAVYAPMEAQAGLRRLTDDCVCPSCFETFLNL